MKCVVSLSVSVMFLNRKFFDWLSQIKFPYDAAHDSIFVFLHPLNNIIFAH